MSSYYSSYYSPSHHDISGAALAHGALHNGRYTWAVVLVKDAILLMVPDPEYQSLYETHVSIPFVPGKLSWFSRVILRDRSLKQAGEIIVDHIRTIEEMTLSFESVDEQVREKRADELEIQKIMKEL